MGDEKNEGPVSNIKEYIVNGRKNGFSDDVIIENLKKTNWPDDVIESAIKEADAVVPAVTEEKPAEPAEEKKEEETKEDKKEEEPTEEKKEEKSKEATSEEKKDEATSDLLTKPPKDIFPEKKESAVQEPVKKKFSILSLIAFLLSPVPFVGLGIAMAAIDHNRKKHKSGTILAILALIINVIVILGIIYILYQIFMLPSENLVGFSKYVNDMFNIV